MCLIMLELAKPENKSADKKLNCVFLVIRNIQTMLNYVGDKLLLRQQWKVFDICKKLSCLWLWDMGCDLCGQK